MSQRPSKKKVILGTVGTLLVVVLVYEWWTGKPPKGEVTHVEANYGAYVALTPAEQRLVDDWVVRFGKATGKAIVAADLYNELPLSRRTTFTAVTHALAHTDLTDRSGKPMNLTALDLVSKIDAVAGSYPHKGGDEQFRIYVEVRPDTMQVLERSREFSRQVDNTLYHKGYPICFRGSGGTPSIQFSLSRDMTRGDVDVDYRSSAFPIMLIDGHLTASNSDVRAGNNDERHNGHWAGLRNWWRGLMGLPSGDAARLEAVAAPGAVASEPRLGKGTKPEDAIADFLRAWFVEKKPDVAVGYVGPRAFSCLKAEEGLTVDRGVARYQIARAMATINQQVGKVDRLADAMSGVVLNGERGREVPQPNRDAFVMYDVRDDLASAFDCENRVHPERADQKLAQSTKFGTYIAAVFRIKAKNATGEAVATLWTKENGRWTLVAYDVEPEFRPGSLPIAPPERAEVVEPAAPVVQGDAAMNQAAAAFFTAWFVRSDTPAAFSYLSPRSYACSNLYREEESADAATPDEAKRAIQERMQMVHDWAGTSAQLDEVLSPVEPRHADIKLVKHGESAAFTIAAIPDSLGAALDCTRLKRGESPAYDAAAATYGQFYVTSSRLKRAGPDAAVLWTVWGRENRSWKIVAFRVVVP